MALLRPCQIWIIWSVAASGVLATPLASTMRRSGRGSPTLEDIKTCTMPPTELTVPARQFSFEDENGQSIEIEWLGSKSRTMFVLCSNMKKPSRSPLPSSLWRSTDGGLYYRNDTNKISSASIISSHGMLKSPADPHCALLVSTTNPTDIFTTTNTGTTWNHYTMPFGVSKFLFHPSRSNLLLASSTLSPQSGKRHLYLSTNFGRTWKMIINDVYTFEWGSTSDKKDTIYASYGSMKDRKVSTLVRSDDLAKHWEVILPTLLHFLVKTKFVFASIRREGKAIRDLFVSERSGKTNTWFRARIPFALPFGSYYVLDTTEQVAFVHLDMIGKGLGMLYTSDSKGVNYDRSLQNHVHHLGKTDFYHVKSMRATYITTVTDGRDPTQNLQSRITFNRGGRWHALSASECTASTADCALHLHGMISKKQNKLSLMSPPLSAQYAHGLIIAHGMVGKYSDTSKADVYISKNGGYLWKKVLSGVHQYVIGDLGKLIVAVPMSVLSLQDTLYYSENYGQCWHKSRFSTTKWHFTGILADPVSFGMQVTLWGYTPKDGLWQTVTMEFQDVIERKCASGDYETFVPHLANKDDDDQTAEGCLLGRRDTVKVVKADRWCRQDKNVHEVQVTSQPCACTRADFECDYGFILAGGKCVNDTSLSGNASRAMLCTKGQKLYHKSNGYRQVAGDVCTGGVSAKYIQWGWAQCTGEEETLTDIENPPKPAKKKHYAGTVIIVLVAFIAFFGGVAVCLRRKRVCVSLRDTGAARYTRVRMDSSTDTDDDAPLLDVSNPKTLRPDATSKSSTATATAAAADGE